MIDILKITEESVRKQYKDLPKDELNEKVRQEIQKVYNIGILNL